MPKSIAALILSLNAAGATAPEWLHVLPAGTFSGVDGRGPFNSDAAALIEVFHVDGRKLPIDENHATDLAGKSGHPSPARGWITDLQARDDGLWGRVEWTAEGAALVTGKAYGYLSPVFTHTAAKPYRVQKMLRVALTNDPNLSLTSLHSREDQTMLEELVKALGLPETADEATVLKAVKDMHAASTTHAALMAKIATAAGVSTDTAGDALVTAIQSRGTSDAVSAENQTLKEQMISLQSQLGKLAGDTAKDKATAVIDQAINDGKIMPVLRDHMIARHVKNAAEVEAEIKVLPSLNAGGLGNRKPPEAGATVITSEDEKIMAMMGVDPAAYAATAKALHGKDQ